MELLAPIAGKILKVFVKVGDVVKETDQLFKLEAMKMEYPIFAPSAGKIMEIKVRENDEVEADDIMLVLSDN
ncbi:MAG: acetyl-CoA carboxylase biotin carboxyl carrier protein subunit [Deltaproteobacteria bacterium]|nr:acetyl-CoA carboxylase biotin carboxyl carrier protein subunit [Deltaproteobacteria bacterium]